MSPNRSASDRPASDRSAESRPASDPPRIDYVSPLPPVRSGIADYSADLLPELALRADVRLVLLHDQPVDAPWRETFATIDSHSWLAEGGDRSRLPVFHMGNNPYHLEVWRLAMEVPGLLVLHDLMLHHFLLQRTAAVGAVEDYRAQLAADHGWVGKAIGDAFEWPGGFGDAARFELPAHRHLLERQRGVVVHNRWAADRLHEELPALRVEVMRMGLPRPQAADAEAGVAFRRRHGLPENVPL
ncbi:MAG: hypothetical protein AAGN46_02545, partial [Acidobacteriota bacterium]